jgi:hypothetical protein
MLDDPSKKAEVEPHRRENTPTAKRMARHEKRAEEGRAAILVDVDTTTIQNLLIDDEQLLPSQRVDYELADPKARAAARAAWRPGVSRVLDSVAALMAYPQFRELLRRAAKKQETRFSWGRGKA